MRLFQRVAIPCALLLVLGCQTVPYTGRSRFLLVSVQEERTLGERAYGEILSKARLSDDQEQVALIRRVGQRLAEAAERPDFAWEFNLIQDDRTINAFCLPGGKVAFYSGILQVAEGEEGIAVVMGHEIAHALARHGAERMSHGMLAKFGGQALSILLAGQSAPAQELYGRAYGLGVGVGVLLPYSRAQESEADHIGLILMAKAGYDPQAALSFWQRMETATQDKASQSPLAQFLRTHPTSAKRQRKIERWLGEVKGQYYRAPASQP